MSENRIVPRCISWPLRGLEIFFIFLALGLLFKWGWAQWTILQLAPEFAADHLPVLELMAVSYASHTIGGSLALMVGDLQFWPAVQRRKKLHRILGWIFVVLVLVVVVSGLWFLPRIFGGWWQGLPVVVFGLLLLWTTHKAIQAAWQRKIEEHGFWMYRSFANLTSNVTVRLFYVPLWVAVMPERVAITWAFWLGWSFNSLVMEWLIYCYKCRKAKK